MLDLPRPHQPLVPAGYVESDVGQGARMEFSGLGEPFGFLYCAFREWRLTLVEADVPSPAVQGKG